MSIQMLNDREFHQFFLLWFPLENSRPGLFRCVLALTSSSYPIPIVSVCLQFLLIISRYVAKTTRKFAFRVVEALNRNGLLCLTPFLRTHTHTHKNGGGSMECFESKMVAAWKAGRKRFYFKRFMSTLQIQFMRESNINCMESHLICHQEEMVATWSAWASTTCPWQGR